MTIFFLCYSSIIYHIFSATRPIWGFVLNKISALSYRTDRLVKIVLSLSGRFSRVHTCLRDWRTSGQQTRGRLAKRNRLATFSGGGRITRHVVLYTRTTVATVAARVQHHRRAYVTHGIIPRRDVPCTRRSNNHVPGYGVAGVTAVMVLRARGRRPVGGWASARRGGDACEYAKPPPFLFPAPRVRFTAISAAGRRRRVRPRYYRISCVRVPNVSHSNVYRHVGTVFVSGTSVRSQGPIFRIARFPLTPFSVRYGYSFPAAAVNFFRTFPLQVNRRLPAEFSRKTTERPQKRRRKNRTQPTNKHVTRPFSRFTVNMFNRYCNYSFTV